jgi:hypothetical protein
MKNNKIQVTLSNQRPRMEILAQLVEMLARAIICIFNFLLFIFSFKTQVRF